MPLVLSVTIFVLLAFLLAGMLLLWRRFGTIRAKQERDKNIGSLFEQQPEAWIILDGISLEAIEANQKAMNLFGVFRRNFLSKLQFSLLFRETLEEEEVQLLLGAVDNGTFVNKLLQCRSLSGRIFPAVVSISRVNEGNLFCRFADPEEQAVSQVLPKNDAPRLVQAEQAIEIPAVKDPTVDNAAPVLETVQDKLPAALPREMVNVMADAVAIIDKQQRFLEVNEQFAALTSYSVEELKQIGFDSLVHPAEGRMHDAWLQSLLGGDQRIARTERKLLRKDRESVYLELLAAVLPNRESVLITAIDNSTGRKEQQALQLSRANLLTLIQNTEEVIFSLDALGVITVINQAAVHFIHEKYQVEVEEGDDFIEAIPLVVKPSWKKNLQAVLAGQVIQYRDTLALTDGDVVYEVFLYPLKNENGLITGLTAFSRNITERIRQEALLAEARDKAEEATKAKSEFLAVMSHEIRTPLNGLIGITGLLTNTSLNTTQKEYVDIIRLSGEALLQVISDILDYSKIEANKMQLEAAPYLSRSPIQETIDILSGKAAEKGLHFTTKFSSEVPEVIVGDKARLRQILMNLVGNALKFTDKGSVGIEMLVAEHQEDEYVLEYRVTDTGVGIPAKQAEQLFAAYAQADASTYRKYGGTGLGLTICKTLVELMGGTIRVESESGKGSSFIFTTKVKAGKRTELAPESLTTQVELPANAIAANYPARILLAEDNDINRLLADRLFARMGYTIEVAANGKEAYDAVSRSRYDIVFMDVQMPEMDGLQASRKIRDEVPEILQPVIIAMTAFAGQEDRQMCLDAGMDDYVSKPITIQDIERMLKKWSNPNTENMKAKTDTKEIQLNNGQDLLSMDAVNRLMDIGKNTDPGFVRQVLDMFMRQAPDSIAEIKDACESGDYTKLWQSAHKLKGTCLNMGAKRMGETCRELEKKGRNLEVGGLMSLVLQLESEYAVTIEEFKKLFEYN